MHCGLWDTYPLWEQGEGAGARQMGVRDAVRRHFLFPLKHSKWAAVYNGVSRAK